MITVKDIWRAALPHETQLIAGGAGLERRVEWATSMRTKPPAFASIKGGEIAFVAIRSIKLLDERLDLTKVIESFAEKGGVACAVLGDVPKESIELADRLMLPLLQLPVSAQLTELEHETIRYIVDERTALHDRSQELQSELMDLALSGSGTKPIIERLAQLTSLPAVLQREDGEITESAGGGNGTDALWHEATAEIARWAETVSLSAANPPVREFSTSKPGYARLVSPVPARDGLGGLVSLIGPEASLDQVVRFACARAASACAIELDRKRAVVAVREDIEGELLQSLLHEGLATDAAMRERSRRVGLDPDGEFQVLTMLRHGGTAGNGFGEAAVRAARKWAEAHQVSGTVGEDNGQLVLVAAAPQSLNRQIPQLLKAVIGASDSKFSAGLGRVHSGIASVKISHQEAEQAARTGVKLHGGGSLTAFSELGLHRMLFAIAHETEVASFYEEMLGVLMEYDRKHKSDLLPTLDAYFLSLCSPSEAAEKLHLHRNTVLYRLNRIEKLLGKPLDNAETRLNLQVALRLHQVLDR